MVVPKLGIYGRFRQNGSGRLADFHAVCGNDVAERVFCDGVFCIFFGSIQRNETNLCNAVILVFVILIKAFVAAGAQLGHAVLHGNVKDFRFTVEFLLAQILLANSTMTMATTIKSSDMVKPAFPFLLFFKLFISREKFMRFAPEKNIETVKQYKSF